VDTVDQITAAIEGRCACGCGHRITDRSPSAWYATEGCQDRWAAQQRGGATLSPAEIAAAAESPPLDTLFRRGYRLALPGSTAPWLRRCGNCGVIDTPGDGRRVLPVTFDISTPYDPTGRAEYEDCNLCQHCGTPTPGPHLTALWRYIDQLGDAYRLTLLHGDRMHQYEVRGHQVRDHSHDRRGLVEAWRSVERHLLRDLAPRCQHSSGCTEPARERCELRAPILWGDRWHAPGAALLLCGRHGAEFHRHCSQRIDPFLGPLAGLYERRPLDWTRA